MIDAEKEKRGNFQKFPRFSFSAFSAKVSAIYLKYVSNQSMKLRCHSRLFCGFSTQWVSSGK